MRSVELRFIGAQIDDVIANSQITRQIGLGRCVGVIAAIKRLRTERKRIVAVVRVRKERQGWIVDVVVARIVRPYFRLK